VIILGQLVQDSVNGASVELFQGYEVELEYIGAKETDNANKSSRVGMIGFTGDAVRGTLAIHVCDALLDATGSNSDNRNDWIAELANQLLGRLKNKLLSYDVVIQLSTPVAVQGEGFKMSFKSALARQFSFKIDDKFVAIYFDGEYDETKEVELCEDTDSIGAPEGEMMMF